jgi:hypothetical protein
MGIYWRPELVYIYPISQDHGETEDQNSYTSLSIQNHQTMGNYWRPELVYIYPISPDHGEQLKTRTRIYLLNITTPLPGFTTPKKNRNDWYMYIPSY